MGFFEDAVVKAKDAFDVAAKKTNDVVALQKLKFKVSQVNSQLSGDFETLGRIYYENAKKSSKANEKYKPIFEQIEEKFAELDSLEEQIETQRKSKVCKNCGHKNVQDASFCNKCGKSL